MKAFKNGVQKIPQLFSTIAWGLSASWKASKLYTAVRIGVEICTPVLAIMSAYLGKYVINLIAVGSNNQRTQVELLVLFAGLLLIALLRMLMQKAQQYCQAMHDEILNSKLSLVMMDRSLSIDLEYHDNPEFHDKIQLANRDMQAINTILWNIITCIGAVITFLGAFVVLLQVHVLYGLLMLVAAVPSSIAASKYAKSLYRLNIEQVNEQRQMSYCVNVAADKRYAQDMRLFSAGERLKKRYEQIWKPLFVRRRSTLKKRTILTALLDSLPEIAVALIGVDIAFKVMSGNATIGDYSLYTGFINQLCALKIGH